MIIKAIQTLLGTTIVTPDNVMTLIGNGKIFGDTIQNSSVLPVRRVERVAQLANGVDPLDAIARLRAAVAQAGWPVPSALHQIRQI
jgi:small conductance mechanosensitive channel